MRGARAAGDRFELFHETNIQCDAKLEHATTTTIEMTPSNTYGVNSRNVRRIKTKQIAFIRNEFSIEVNAKFYVILYCTFCVFIKHYSIE